MESDACEKSLDDFDGQQGRLARRVLKEYVLSARFHYLLFRTLLAVINLYVE